MKGRARVPSWSELVHLLDLKTTVKLKFTAWFEVNPTFGSRDTRFLNPMGHYSPSPLLILSVEEI